MRRGRVASGRLRVLRGRRIANDGVSLVLMALGLVAGGTALVALLFWSGWVLLALLLPLGWLAWRWFAGLGQVGLARAVERAFPDLDGRLVAALELAEYRSGSREGYSEELLAAAVSEVDRLIAHLSLARLVRRRRLLAGLLVLVAGVGLLAGYRQLAPDRWEIGIVNAFAPGRVKVKFQVMPGDTTVLPGVEVSLRCRVEPGGVFSEVVMEQVSGPVEAHRIALEDGVAAVSVAAGDGFEYRFRVLGRSSETHRVRVLEPLTIEQMSFTYSYPDYSGLAEYRSGGTDIVALRGTRIEVSGRVSGVMLEGRIAFGGDTVELGVDSEQDFTGRFTVAGDDRGVIELRAAAGGGHQRCGAVTIRVRPDEVPMVRLFRPGRDVDLPMSMQVLLGIHSLDDFGLGALYLEYGSDSLTNRVRIKGLAGRREDTTHYTWDLSDVGLLPGDELRYRVRVTDNDDVSGPKSGRSETFKVRFPTMSEIYNASVRRTERTTEELAPLRDTQEQLSEELARISEQVRSEGQLSWEERQALEEVLAEMQGLAQHIAELREDVRQLMDEMMQGATLDRETMARMGQLQEMLSELLPRELQESLARLQQSLQESMPEVNQALEQFELDQEQLRENIDRALEFLQRVMEEQRLEALARAAEELARTEEELSEQLGDAPDEELARMQDEVKSGLDSLLAEMQDLAETMSDSGIGDSLDALAEQAEADSLSDLASQVSEALRKGQQSEAGQKSGKMAGKLKQLSESLDALSSKMKKKRSDEVAGQLLAIAGELLMVSREQERLELEVVSDPHVDERVPFQMGLHEATGVVAESLSALAGRTMAVSSRMARELARAMGEMQVAAQQMVGSRGGPARHRMAVARGGLDRVAAWLLAALEQAQQGGGMSGDMESLMEALSKMTGDQMAINSGTSGIPLPIPGGMNAAQMQALSRLMSQQAALRERLEQLLDELGGQRPGLTGSLEQLLDEMKQVEQDLAARDIDRDLIERQESILSHLLDAQRSVRQKGFKEQRESEAAKSFDREPIPGLPEDLGERNRVLREELMRALKEGRLGKYERAIREYFEMLLNQP